MSELTEGSEAPDFCLPDQDGQEVCLGEYRGKWVILYFYPKDNTRGCTQEAKDFTTLIEEFERLGAVVLGVSPDSVKSHKRFQEKHGLRVRLLSDPEKEVIRKYGAWGKKKMAGREYFGVIRSTFLIGPEGKVRKVWPKVKVKGHAEEVLNTLKSLIS
ncbi:MAG: thioredoxin-dependent thiol peroxidase [Candidatus Korarchaeota archaeon]|nr:thioredoxin-dependent thiol peroxidase [Candidatus Korarchaeota archaeon]